MKKIILSVLAVSCVMTGCNNDKKVKQEKQFALLTCESSKENRTKEELQVIGDACFRKGNYKKSKPQSW